MVSRSAWSPRQTDKLRAFAEETGARLFKAYAADRDAIAAVFDLVEHSLGALEEVIYNASVRTSRRSLLDLEADLVEKHLATSAMGRNRSAGSSQIPPSTHLLRANISEPKLKLNELRQ